MGLGLLVATTAGISGCTGERRLEAADMSDAPIVTIRTLTTTESRAPAKLALYQAEDKPAGVEKAEPERPVRPRRRRKARRIQRERPVTPVRTEARTPELDKKPAEAVESEKKPAEPARHETAPAEKRERSEPHLSAPVKSPAPDPVPAPEPEPDPEPTDDPGSDGM